MLKIPEGLPDSMTDFLIECESEDYIPSADEFEEAFAGHDELDWWMDALQLPELRQELSEEVTDEGFSRPRTLEDQLRECGIKFARDFL